MRKKIFLFFIFIFCLLIPKKIAKADSQKAYFIKASEVSFYNETKTNKIGGGATFGTYVNFAEYDNTSIDNSKYIVYRNAVVSGTEYYDLVIYPFKVSTNAKVITSTTKLGITPGVVLSETAGYAGFKLVVTTHASSGLGVPVNITVKMAFSDLDNKEFVALPTSSTIIHLGNHLNTSNFDVGGFTQYINTQIANTDDKSYNLACVVIEENITSSGFVFYYGKEDAVSCASSLGFEEVNNYIQENAYQIKFDANGGSGLLPADKLVYGTSISTIMGNIGDAVPTRSGYIFKGWSAHSSYNSNNPIICCSDVTGATITNPSWTYVDYCNYTGGSISDSTLTLYAQWELDEAEYTVNHYAQNEDGTYSLVQTEILKDQINKEVSPDVYTQTGRNNPEKQSIVITEDGKAVINYYYDIIREDKSGTVSWNDHNNLYKTRPNEVTVYIYRNGVLVDEQVVSAINNVNEYTFSSMQKYDLETGEELIWTVKQSVAYSQAADATSEDKYITKNNGFNFINTIRNTDADRPAPDKPDDKGYYIEGNIYWEDNNDSLGFRPSEVTITLYQKGENGKWVKFNSVVINTNAGNRGIEVANEYLFDWLPKYWYDEDDVPTMYEYKVEESFTSWYVEDGKIKDAYKIVANQPNDNDFTNTLIFTNKPIIHVNEYENTIIIKTNTEDKVEIILKPVELFINDDYSVSYGNKTNDVIKVFTDITGTSIENVPATKYEIILNESGCELDNIVLTLSENMELEEDNGKYYIIIKNQPDDAIGNIVVNVTKKTANYQDSNRRNNYFVIMLDAVSINTESVLSDLAYPDGQNGNSISDDNSSTNIDGKASLNFGDINDSLVENKDVFDSDTKILKNSNNDFSIEINTDKASRQNADIPDAGFSSIKDMD